MRQRSAVGASFYAGNFGLKAALCCSSQNSPKSRTFANIDTNDPFVRLADHPTDPAPWSLPV